VQFINSTLGNNTYSWNYGDGTTSAQIEEIHNYNNTTQGYFITLAVTTPAGCTDSLTQFIGYEEQLVYYVPNTFTPDQDEHNQTWKPIFTSGFDPFNYHLVIYNRWGELIWESFNHSIGWDGTYNKIIPVQAGTYTWVIDFHLKNNDDKQSLTGTVNVLR
jgi:gliding motility-associated-like protein